MTSLPGVAVSVHRRIRGGLARSAAGPSTGAHAGGHQRDLRALLQLLVPPGRPGVPVHAGLQPGHRGHRGQGQPGGYLPLLAGKPPAEPVSSLFTCKRRNVYDR